MPGTAGPHVMARTEEGLARGCTRPLGPTPRPGSDVDASGKPLIPRVQLLPAFAVTKAEVKARVDPKGIPSTPRALGTPTTRCSASHAHAPEGGPHPALSARSFWIALRRPPR